MALLASALYFERRQNYDRTNNDLKYRYIRMKGEASPESISGLENLFEFNRDNGKIKQMRKDVETYEEAVRRQTALIEQARLKERAAREQEVRTDTRSVNYALPRGKRPVIRQSFPCPVPFRTFPCIAG